MRRKAERDDEGMTSRRKIPYKAVAALKPQ